MKSIKSVVIYAVLILLMLSSCNNSSKSKEGNVATQTTKHEHKMDDKVYQCSMHPHIMKDEAGNCPICDMTLEEKTYHEALTYLAAYKKDHPDYQEGDSALMEMNEIKDMKGMGR